MCVRSPLTIDAAHKSATSTVSLWIGSFAEPVEALYYLGIKIRHIEIRGLHCRPVKQAVSADKGMILHAILQN